MYFAKDWFKMQNRFEGSSALNNISSCKSSCENIRFQKTTKNYKRCRRFERDKLSPQPHARLAISLSTSSFKQI